MSTTATNSKKPKRRSASRTVVGQRGPHPRTTAKNSGIKIATCRFCKRELLFDTLLRRFVGRRGSVEGRPCRHLVAAGVEQKITTRVRGKEMLHKSKFAWFAGKTREIVVYGRSIASSLAARIESSLMYGRGLERWADVQAIREVLPTAELSAGEVECAADMAVAAVFARDPKVFLDRFEEKNPGDLDDFEEEEEEEEEEVEE